MILRAAPIALATLLLSPVPSAHAAMSAGEAQAILFKTQDVNGDGYISPREFEGFRRQAKAAMDSDGDGRVSREEWGEFDPGFLGVAEEAGRGMALMDAKDAVFARYDVSGDAYLSNEEMMAGLFRDFLEADADDDGRISPDEAKNVRIIMTFADSLMR